MATQDTAHTVSVSLLDDDDNDDDDNDDDDGEEEEEEGEEWEAVENIVLDSISDTTAILLSLSVKSLFDNRPSDTIASLKVFWPIWWQRSMTTGLIMSPASRSLDNIHVYTRTRSIYILTVVSYKSHTTYEV